jgi:hypothetical protein
VEGERDERQGGGGPHYLQQCMREQSRTIVTEHLA